MIIALVGPTATGKTARSVALAKRIGAAGIISADSRLVYQGLNIGTAKPTVAEQAGVPHYLIDVATPTTPFTVVDYRRLATPVLQRLQQEGPVIVTGGTGLYLQALLQNGYVAPVSPKQGFRQQLADITTPALYQRLQGLDPRRAGDLYAEDRVRIIRALEIIAVTGHPVPIATPVTNLPGVLWLGLTYNNRDHHRQLITQRVQQMLADGWLAEVQTLVDTYGPDVHALGITHGYPECMAHLQGDLTKDELVASISLQVQQYARRQRTWFARNSAIHWQDVGEDSVETWCDGVIEKLSNLR
jgi:tRNA dimethylallyltransferase